MRSSSKSLDVSAGFDSYRGEVRFELQQLSDLHET